MSASRFPMKKTKADKDDEALKSYLREHYGDELVVADGLSRAFVCVAKTGQNYVCVYNSKKIIQILRKRDKMSHDDAWEYFCYNILGAHVGDNTPVFINPDEHTEVWPQTVYGRV